MSRSPYGILHRLYGTVPSDDDLQGRAAVARAELVSSGLLPEGPAAAAASTCGDLSGTTVAVVGAGFAGLTAAWYLTRCGLSVTVFESSDHVGGRVRTDDDLVGGKIVEAGAELIGLNHPMWWSLASAFGLTLTPLTTSEEYEQAGLEVRLRLGGHDITGDERKQLFADLENLIDLIGADARAVDPIQPWMSPNAADWDQQSVAQRVDELLGASSSLVRDFFDFMVGNDNCAAPGQQSYLGLLALVSAGRMGDDLRGYWEYTETHRCAGGNQQLARELAATLTDLRLESPVDTITLSQDSVGIDWSGASGGSAAFDHVVLATAPAVWPAIEGSDTWDPAVFTMSHGPAVKFLSAVDTEFWVPDGLAPSALSDQLGSLWEGTDKQPTGQGGFCLSVYSGGTYVLAEADYPAQIAQLYPSITPFATRFVDWPNIPGVMTGYSVPAPGEVTTVGSNLFAPFAERLHFAGEQSCLGFFGYMEGALQSGARAARTVLGVVCPQVLTA
jgi:monoamine oxidase